MCHYEISNLLTAACRLSATANLGLHGVDGYLPHLHEKVLSRRCWDGTFEIEQRVWIRDRKRLPISDYFDSRSFVNAAIRGP